MKNKKSFLIAICMLGAFALFTALACIVDVKDIGPQGSKVGFASFNEFMHNFTGVHMMLYYVTDWLSIIPVLFCFGFAVLGLCQWIKRKSIRKVDADILLLGAFYIVVAAVYIFFEEVVINSRPILINGYLEASYPSSTTVLVLTVMLTAIAVLDKRIKTSRIKNTVKAALLVFAILMVLGRFASGVHWATDIIGGALLSTGLVHTYGYISGLADSNL